MYSSFVSVHFRRIKTGLKQVCPTAFNLEIEPVFDLVCEEMLAADWAPLQHWSSWCSSGTRFFQAVKCYHKAARYGTIPRESRARGSSKALTLYSHNRNHLGPSSPASRCRGSVRRGCSSSGARPAAPGSGAGLGLPGAPCGERGVLRGGAGPLPVTSLPGST